MGGLNTFGYAYQNPILNIDPSGLFAPSTIPLVSPTTEGIIVAGGVGVTAPVSAFLTALAAAAWPSSVGDGSDIVPKECKSSDEDGCAYIQEQINRLVDSLSWRYRDMRIDRHRLYGQGVTPNGSWSGHQKRFNSEQEQLKIWVDMAIEKGCPYNPDANNWLIMSPPKKPDWAMIRDRR